MSFGSAVNVDVSQRDSHKKQKEKITSESGGEKRVD